MLLWILACTPNPPADPVGVAPAHSLDVQMPFEAVLVPVSIQGGPALTFMLDTGAPTIGLDRDLFPELDCDAGIAVQLDDLALDGLPCEWIDLELESSLLGQPIAGLLGLPLLQERVVVIDYAGRRIHLLDGWEEQLFLGEHTRAGWTEVPWTPLDEELIGFEVQVEGSDSRLAVLDTGTTGSVIPDSLLELLAEDGRPVLEGSSMVSGSSSASAPLVRMRSVGTGAVVSAQTWAAAAPDGYFGVLSSQLDAEVGAILGGSWLREHAVAMDFSTHTLYFAAYLDSSHVPNEFRGVGVEVMLEPEGWSLFTVFIGSDAEAQGLMPGDRLRAVDGEPTDDLELDALLDLLRGEPGTTATLTLEREGVELEAEVLREELL